MPRLGFVVPRLGMAAGAFAEAGGRQPEKVDEMLAAAAGVVEAQLGKG